MKRLEKAIERQELVDTTPLLISIIIVILLFVIAVVIVVILGTADIDRCYM